mgnify:CR=1 FL=1
MKHLAQDEAAFHSQHMRQCREILAVNTAKVGNITRGNTENVITLAGNQKTSQNLWDVRGGGLELSHHRSKAGVPFMNDALLELMRKK